MENEIEIFYSKDWPFDPTQGKLDYELLDTGEGEKLERFGPYIFVRPYEDAVWPKALTKEMKELWNRADGKFWSSKVGAIKGWKFKNKIEKLKKNVDNIQEEKKKAEEEKTKESSPKG